MVFKRYGRISKFDSFNWNGKNPEVQKSYNYLGVTSYSSGSFDLTAAEFVKKGLMAGSNIFFFEKYKTLQFG